MLFGTFLTLLELDQLFLSCNDIDGYSVGDQDCIEAIIAIDDYCVDVEWDQICQDAYEACVDAVDGCTDVYACNYDPAATNDDGSCDYTDAVWYIPNTPGDGPAIFSCNPIDGYFAGDQDCIELVITNDPFCVDTSWDGICQDAYEACLGGGDCDLICPANADVECGTDTSVEVIGTAVIVGNCDGQGEVEYSDEVEGDDCFYTIYRTFTYTLVTGEVLSCTQEINVADTTGPVFTNSVEDITVDCDENVPAQEACEAEDACNGVAEIGDYSSETGNATDSCVLSTAFGPGPDWAIWLPTLVDDELAPSAYWAFEENEGYLIAYDDGTAHLWGSIYNIDDNSLTMDLTMWFENKFRLGDMVRHGPRLQR